jgi:hypothetical protein
MEGPPELVVLADRGSISYRVLCSKVSSPGSRLSQLREWQVCLVQ